MPFQPAIYSLERAFGSSAGYLAVADMDAGVVHQVRVAHTNASVVQNRACAHEPGAPT